MEQQRVKLWIFSPLFPSINFNQEGYCTSDWTQIKIKKVYKYKILKRERANTEKRIIWSYESRDLLPVDEIQKDRRKCVYASRRRGRVSVVYRHSPGKKEIEERAASERQPWQIKAKSPNSSSFTFITRSDWLVKHSPSLAGYTAHDDTRRIKKPKLKNGFSFIMKAFDFLSRSCYSCSIRSLASTSLSCLADNNECLYISSSFCRNNSQR